MKKLKNKTAIICGGRSVEHSLSIVSAKNISEHLSIEHDIVIICINYDGNWHYGNHNHIKNENSLLEATFDWENTPVINLCQKGILLHNYIKIDTVDNVFPITNGIDGHQGSIPGMMKLLDIPCVGSDIFETVACIDKEITKSLLENANLPIVPYLVGRETTDYSFKQVVQKLGLPFFVKPCRLSSSFGVSEVTKEEQYTSAINNALEFDSKYLIEVAVKGREIESAVIGNNTPIVSDILGEIVCNDFYSHSNKYQNTKNTKILYPANISEDIKTKIINYSSQAYKILDCKGFARIDFFLSKNNEIYINEMTTLPLFTQYSMFPKLWGENLDSIMNSLIELSYEK